MWGARFCILLSHRLGSYPLSGKVDHNMHTSQLLIFLYVQGKADGTIFLGSHYL